MRSSQEVVRAKDLPWRVIEEQLIDLGYVRYRSERDARVIASVDCCGCQRGLEYVGLHVGERWLAFGFCGACGSWIHMDGTEEERVLELG